MRRLACGHRRAVGRPGLSDRAHRPRLAAADARLLPAAFPPRLDDGDAFRAAARRLRRAVRPAVTTACCWLPRLRCCWPRSATRNRCYLGDPLYPTDFLYSRQIFELMPLLRARTPAARPSSSRSAALRALLPARRALAPLAPALSGDPAAHAHGAARRRACRRSPSSSRSWITPPSPGPATGCRSSRSCGTRRRITPRNGFAHRLRAQRADGQGGKAPPSYDGRRHRRHPPAYRRASRCPTRSPTSSW